MGCCKTKIDLCYLVQETYASPTFNFKDIDVSLDTFIYKTNKLYTCSDEREFEVDFIDNNTIYIVDVDLPISEYNHELLWIRNGIETVVFQGKLTITNKAKDCGCGNNNFSFEVVNEEVTVSIDFEERIIERITDKGPTGDSAYQVAVENGFVGTEAEWLESLKLHYSDLTEAEILELQQPAIEAAQTANTAADNANVATQNANTSAQKADDARLAIQDDLALKADQTDLEQLESEVSLKVRNLITNGDFVTDINGWSATGMSVEHDSGRLRAYNWLATSNKIISPAMEGLSIGDLLYLRIGEYERSALPASTNIIIARINDTTPNIINERGNPNLIIQNLSGIAAYNGETPQIQIRTYQGAGNSVWIDDVVCINLTETFGAGNEPTEEEMNLLLDITGLIYIDDEAIIPAQKIMQWQLALIRKNKNAIIALGGTII